METLAHTAGSFSCLNWYISRTQNGTHPRIEGTAKPHKASGPLPAEGPTASDTGDTGDTKGSPGTQGTRRASWDTGEPQGLLGHRKN